MQLTISNTRMEFKNFSLEMNQQKISQGLKYLKLSFPKPPKNHYENINRDDPGRQSTGAESRINSAYIRQASLHGDFFPGGTDSANTEATLIPRNQQTDGDLFTKSI